MTTPTDLNELDRLRAAATQGKLYMDPYHHSDGSISYDLSIGDYESLGTITEPSNLDKPEKGNRKSLAELIVALVNAYPALAAELRELRELMAAVSPLRCDTPCKCDHDGECQYHAGMLHAVVLAVRAALATCNEETP